MKRLILVLIFFSFIFSVKNFPTPGEFLIYKTVASTDELTLQLRSIGDIWLWDKITNMVYPGEPYNALKDSTWFGFDAPKSVDVGKDGVMPWGLMEFTWKEERQI